MWSWGWGPRVFRACLGGLSSLVYDFVGLKGFYERYWKGLYRLQSVSLRFDTGLILELWASKTRA